MTIDRKGIDARNKAFALREEQEMEAAYALISRAAQLLPDDPQTLFAHAQISFETGRPSIALFDAAAAFNGDNPGFIRNRAAACAAEGRVDQAVAQLETILAKEPGWLDGHRLLANLRITSGDLDPARSYAQAALNAPDNLSLRLAWFHLLSSARDWDGAQKVIEEGEGIFGARAAFALARAFIASESGKAANNPHLFDHLEDVRDPGLDLCQTRHWLRLGDPARAEKYAARNIGTSAEAGFWPYLSIIWRQTGDQQAEWLDRPDQFIRSCEIPFTLAELQTLADTLRQLHTARAPYLEQSVRGGTQTDGHLLLRHEPAIQAVRKKLAAAVRSYISALPPAESGHPLLAPQRDRVMLEGSWSVRLASQGFHSCHTHSKGWISSALYVSLPPPDEMGKPPAGWIEFGTPPPELGLPLAPYTRIEPAPARLALFPSTMWHGTIPFDQGERLTIAFDIRRPANS